MPNGLDPSGANASDPGILTSDGRGAERQAFIQVRLARDRRSPVQSPRHRYRDGIAPSARRVRGRPGLPLEAVDVAYADFAFAI
jgi:hypothetical protein